MLTKSSAPFGLEDLEQTLTNLRIRYMNIRIISFKRYMVPFLIIALGVSFSFVIFAQAQEGVPSAPSEEEIG